MLSALWPTWRAACDCKCSPKLRRSPATAGKITASPGVRGGLGIINDDTHFRAGSRVSPSCPLKGCGAQSESLHSTECVLCRMEHMPMPANFEKLKHVLKTQGGIKLGIRELASMPCRFNESKPGRPINDGPTLPRGGPEMGPS